MLNNRIINGDSIIEMRKLPENSIDLIFADPPYWMRTNGGSLKRVEGTEFKGVYEDWDKFTNLENYKEFTKNWLIEAKRILKPNGSIWVICGMQCIFTVGSIMQDIGLWLINDVIWHKSNPTPNFMGTRLNNSHETLIWATKSKKSKYTFNYKTAKELNRDTVNEKDFEKGKRKQMGSIWKLPVSSGNERLKDSEGNKLHSTQKPEKLLYKIIAISSKVGDIVLDPFAGTMTTGAVAKRMGRNYLMIEKELKYCQYGEKRIELEKVHIGDIEKGSYDIKPIRATMDEMIKHGYFKIGEKFCFKGSDNYAILIEKGKLMYENKEFSMHELAAKFSNRAAERLNGFDYWYVERDNNRVLISRVREEYRKFKASKE